MSIEPNPTPLFADAIGPWHDHFCWLPIRTYDQRLVWLRWVRRRCVEKRDFLRGGPDAWFQYHDEFSDWHSRQAEPGANASKGVTGGERPAS